jgi:hypothetical protein
LAAPLGDRKARRQSSSPKSRIGGEAYREVAGVYPQVSGLCYLRRASVRYGEALLTTMTVGALTKLQIGAKRYAADRN